MPGNAHREQCRGPLIYPMRTVNYEKTISLICQHRLQTTLLKAFIILTRRTLWEGKLNNWNFWHENGRILSYYYFTDSNSDSFDCKKEHLVLKWLHAFSQSIYMFYWKKWHLHYASFCFRLTTPQWFTATLFWLSNQCSLWKIPWFKFQNTGVSKAMSVKQSKNF